MNELITVFRWKFLFADEASIKLQNVEICGDVVGAKNAAYRCTDGKQARQHLTPSLIHFSVTTCITAYRLHEVCYF